VTRAADTIRIACVWEQFAPYHGDRIAAVARRLRGRAVVAGIEIAPGSRRYGWAPSGAIAGADKLTLFPGREAEQVGRLARHVALRRALRGQDLVLLGLASSDPAVALLAQGLRRDGATVVFCSDSKADDYPRNQVAERAKRILLRGYDGGLVAGPRSEAYYRGLGVERLWPGYDTLSVARMRSLGAVAANLPFASRPFLFLGRFVRKKALDVLLDAYAAYVAQSRAPRGLVLAGDGPLRPRLEAQAQALGVASRIRWTGFLGPEDGAREMAQALALVLPSTEEQWGLVVNEAVSLGLPTIVSEQVGARDLLVRDSKNGLVVPTGDRAALAAALLHIESDEAAWQAMCTACTERSWYADSKRFADAVEDIAFPGDPAVAAKLARQRDG
jgi:glycosyltransferase involved in cell wall biosynthesis